MSSDLQGCTATTTKVSGSSCHPAPLACPTSTFHLFQSQSQIRVQSHFRSHFQPQFQPRLPLSHPSVTPPSGPTDRCVFTDVVSPSDHTDCLFSFADQDVGQGVPQAGTTDMTTSNHSTSSPVLMAESPVPVPVTVQDSPSLVPLMESNVGPRHPSMNRHEPPRSQRIN